MDIKNKIISWLSKETLRRNGKFKNLHKGESCYLFGTGVSLKEMDLKKFSNKIAIGCNHIWFHKDYKHLNMKYYIHTEPYFFYPKFLKPAPYVVFMERKWIRNNPNISVFTSLANRLALLPENVYYVYHFDRNDNIRELIDMEKYFYYYGVVHASVLAAIYMGFTSATLVGFDYTFSPMRLLHFYERGKGLVQEYSGLYMEFFNEVRNLIDIKTMVTPGITSKLLDYVDYESHFGCRSEYRENTEIVSEEILAEIRKVPVYCIDRDHPKIGSPNDFEVWKRNGSMDLA